MEKKKNGDVQRMKNREDDRREEGKDGLARYKLT